MPGRRIFLHLILLMVLVMVPMSRPLRAQGPGPGGSATAATDLRYSTSVRPVLVRVTIDGNSGISSALILSRIQTKPTQVTFLEHFFGTFARISDFDIDFKIIKSRWLYTDAYRAAMHRMLDSIAGDIRYFNSTSAAADTIKIRDLYADNGYHDATARYVVSVDTLRNTATVHFLIHEGERYPLHGIHYLGMSDVPADIMKKVETPELVDLGKGYDKDKLTAERDRVVLLLKNSGYAFASSDLITVFQVRNGPHGERLEHPYDSAMVSMFPGTRYHFGHTSYSADSTAKGTPVDSATVYQQIEYKEGDWYSARAVEQTVANLYGLGTFDLVRVDTASRLSHGDTLGMQINTRLRQLNEVQGAPEISYEKRGNEGFPFLGATVGYTRYNFLGGAEQLGVNGRIQARLTDFGEQQYGVSGSYFVPSAPGFPIVGGSHLSMLIVPGFDYAVEDRIQGATLSEDVVLRSQRISVIFPELTYRFPKYTYLSLLTFRLLEQKAKYIGVENYISAQAATRVASASGSCDSVQPTVEEALRNSIYRVQVLQGDNPALVATPLERAEFDELKWSTQFSVAATADHRNDLFSPTDGDFADLRLEGGGTGIIYHGFTGGFAKINFDYRRYIPSGARNSWAFRGHAGWIFEFGRLPLTPLSSRFSAGGAYSMRGWDARSMLVTSEPIQAAQNDCASQIVGDILTESRRLIGGLGIIELMSEFRWNPFNLPATTAVKRQLNNIGFIFFADAGNAYFRDYKQDSVLLGSPLNALKTIITNMGVDVGMSLAYSTPVGPFRIGVGYPLYDPVNHTGAERFRLSYFNVNDFVIHIALGHAF